MTSCLHIMGPELRLEEVRQVAVPVGRQTNTSVWLSLSALGGEACYLQMSFVPVVVWGLRFG